MNKLKEIFERYKQSVKNAEALAKKHKEMQMKWNKISKDRLDEF